MTHLDDLTEKVAGTTDMFLLKAPNGVPSAGISEGDWLAVREQSAATAGDVAVSMADGDTVLSAGPPADGAHVVGVVAR